MSELPDDPFTAFGLWFEEATKTEPADPNAMTVATAALSGRPSARIALLKEWDARGLVFYTNLESRKSREIQENPQVALLFHWKSLQRQIRIEGRASLVTESEADRYFAGRPRLSRLGAWASAQSRPLPDRAAFESKLAEFDAKFPGDVIPRPPFWSGWRVNPDYFEFWQDKPHRLHDRHAYTLSADGWERGLLYP